MKPYFAALAVLSFVSFAAAAVTVRPDQQALHISTGGLGGFKFDYPAFVDAKNKPVGPVQKDLADGKVKLTYANGAVIEVAHKGGEITLSLSNLPKEARQLRLASIVPQERIAGWSFQVGRSKIAFPAEKPAKPHLFSGNDRALTLANDVGQSATFHLPPHTFIQVTDNREWNNWKTVKLQFQTPIDSNLKTLQYSVTAEGPTSVKPRVIVDQFGQDMAMDFPDKVKSEDELKADVEAEKSYYASLNPPTFDRFGGLPGSGEKLGLKKTGFFHVQKITLNGREKWVMVNPDGNVFFHLGVCSFIAGYNMTLVHGREGVYELLPPKDGEFKTAYDRDGKWFSFHVANRIRKYGRPHDPESFSAEMIERVRKFGFNSGAAFGPPAKGAREAASFPYVGSLPLSQWGQGIKRIPGVRETMDPFDPQTIAKVEKAFAGLARNADDPLLIGYLIINEPLYEHIPRVVPTLKGSEWACKRELVTFLRDKYGTIEKFNEAWQFDATSFDEMNDRGLPVKTRDAAADMNGYFAHFMETYFKLIHDNFRKHDQNHLLLGNRLQSGTINNETLCRIMARYVDVVSYNYYTYGLDHKFLDKIYGWTGKPFIFSEFYWNSPSDSGLPGGVKDVKNQDERGLAYRQYVEQAAARPDVVGVEWFNLVDAARTGVAHAGFDGERPNCGLIATTDRPWKAMIAHMVKTNYDIYSYYLGEKTPFVYNDPRFIKSGHARGVVNIPRATGPIKLDGGNTNWPGTPAETISSGRIVQGADAGGLEAAFKLCWDDQNLYVQVNVADATPMRGAKKPESIWNADAVELFVGGEKVEQGGALLFTDRQVLMAANAEPLYHFANLPAGETAKLDLHVAPNVDGKGYTLTAAIPFEALKIKPEEGTTIRFDLAVDDSGTGESRQRQIMWNGGAKNSTDRTDWGTARFVR